MCQSLCCDLSGPVVDEQNIINAAGFWQCKLFNNMTIYRRNIRKAYLRLQNAATAISFAAFNAVVAD